jgi:hypothetical protein
MHGGELNAVGQTKNTDLMRRRLLIGVLATALSLAAAGTALWAYRVDFLTWTLSHLLERQGFGPASFAIDAVDLQVLRAHDLTLRGGAIKVAELTIAYSPLELLSSHLGQVDIGGFSLDLAATKDGLQIGGKPLAIAAGNSPTAGGLRIDSLTIRDARLLLDTAEGRFEAAISATLAPSAGNIQGSAFSATLTGPIAGARRKAHVTAQTLGIELPAAGGVQLTLQGATFALDGLPWNVQGAGGQFTWQAEKTTAQLTIDRLTNNQKPMLVTPLRASASVTLAGNRLDFSLQAKAIAKGALTMQAKGQYDRASQAGMATLALGPVTFHRGALQPGDLFPAFGSQIEDLEGSLALAGVLRWKGTSLSPDLVLTLNQLAFATAAAQVQNLNGALKITRLWPPATAASQTLSGTILAPGLPPTDLTLKGQLDAKPALKLDQLAFGFAGGQITTTPFVIDPAAPAFEATLQVNGVDLAEITKLLSLEGLSGTGKLDGPVPIAVHNGKVEIKAGRLAAREPGVLNYRPSSLPDALASAGSSVELALQVLSDFHYDKLELGLDKADTGEGSALLHLEGQNPAVMSGQIFHFNIRLESNFDRLADIALTSLRSAEALLRGAARRATP